ncbi:MAG: hypothetical protein V4820_06310 [Pseudomonadota bacterium]
MQVGASSLANSLFASDPLSALGQVGKTDSARSTPPSAADLAAQKAEAAKVRQQSELEQIRDKGIYAWAQEQKLAKLKEKIRAEVIAERGGSTDLAAIEGEVARRVQEAMEAALKAEVSDAARRGEAPKPMIIDISV